MKERAVEKKVNELRILYLNQSFVPFLGSNLRRLEEKYQGSVAKSCVVQVSNVQQFPVRVVLKEEKPAEPGLVLEIEGVTKYFVDNGFLAKPQADLSGLRNGRYKFTQQSKDTLSGILARVTIPEGVFLEGGIYTGFADPIMLDEGVFAINSFTRDGEFDNDPFPLQFMGVDLIAHKNLSVEFSGTNNIAHGSVYEDIIFNFSPIPD